MRSMPPPWEFSGVSVAGTATKISKKCQSVGHHCKYMIHTRMDGMGVSFAPLSSQTSLH